MSMTCRVPEESCSVRYPGQGLFIFHLRVIGTRSHVRCEVGYDWNGCWQYVLQVDDRWCAGDVGDGGGGDGVNCCCWNPEEK